MKKCKICFNDERQAFPVFFNDGICSACLNHHEGFETNYLKVEDQFLDKVYATKAKYYQCLVPVFGDREDWILIDKLLSRGISVMVSWVNSYFNTELAFQNYQNLVSYYDLDALTLNPNITTYRKMVEKSLYDHQHILLPYQMLQHSFAANTAIENKIPYVIYPYNQAVEFAGTFSRSDRVTGNSWSIAEFNYLGLSVESFSSTGSHILMKELKQYQRPSDERCSGRFIIEYFSNYCLYNPNLTTSDKYSECQKSTENVSIDKFYRAGCGVYYDTHDLLRFGKFGYIKARDHLSRSLRFNEINKQEALERYKHYLAASRTNTSFFGLFDITKTGKQWLEKKYFDPIRAAILSESGTTESNRKPQKATFFTKAINI